MHNQPIPAPHHRIPLGSYTDAAEDRIAERAAEAIDVNRQAREIMMTAWLNLSILPPDVPIMVAGYDWQNVLDLIAEMMPKVDDARHQMSVFDWARDREEV